MVAKKVGAMSTGPRPDDFASVRLPDPSEFRISGEVTSSTPSFSSEDPVRANAAELAAGSESPEHSVAVGYLAEQTGIPPDIVRTNFDTIRKERARSDFNADELRRRAPTLSQWLESRQNFSALRNDIEHLGNLEWMIRAGWRSLVSGVKQAEYGIRSTLQLNDPIELIADRNDKIHKLLGDRLGSLVADQPSLNAMWMLRASGLTGAQQEPRLRQLEAQDLSDQYGAKRLVSQGFVEAMRQVPQIAGAVASSVLGAAAGGAAGTLGEPDPTDVVTVPVGAVVGTFAGPFVWTYAQEAGPAYREFLGLEGDGGKPMPRPLAKLGGQVVGVTNAAIEAVTFKYLARVIPGGSKLISGAARRRMASLLSEPTFRAALQRRLSDYAKFTASETFQEMAQEIVPIVYEATIHSGMSGEAPSSEQVKSYVDRVIDVAYRTFAATVVSGGIMTSANVGSEAAKAARRDGTDRVIEKLHGIAKDLEISKHDPSFVEKLLGEADDSGSNAVFIPVETFETLFQEEEIAPEDAANRLGIADQYQKAKASGDKIEIPIGTYVSKIAGTNLAEKLAPSVTFGPEEFTRQEADAFRSGPLNDQIEQIVKEHGEPAQDMASQVYESLSSGLVATGSQDVATARRSAALIPALIRTQTSRFNEQRAAEGQAELRQEDLFPGYKFEVVAGSEEGAGLDQADQVRRGYVQISTDRRTFRIGLLDQANLSTFLHETGHVFHYVLEELAGRDDAPQQVKDDHAAISSWLKAKPGEELTTEQRELFARSFEQWLMEGKAPSPELAGPFARYRAWLSRLYSTLKSIGGDLTPEVSDIFRRLVATDQEIAQVEAALNLKPLAEAVGMFRDAEHAGVSDGQFLAYRDLVNKAHDQAREEVAAQIAEELRVEQSAEYQQRRAEIRQEVTERVDAMRQFKAARAIRLGTTDSGVSVPKLSGSLLAKRYGEEWPQLRRGLAFLYASEESGNGADPEAIAEGLDYRSGDELIRDLASRGSRSALIDQKTKERIDSEMAGITSSPERLNDAALSAVESGARGRVLLREYALLRKKVGSRVMTAEDVFEQAAAAIISSTRFMSLDPQRHARTQARRAKQSFEAAAKGRFDEALLAKKQELVSFHLYRKSRTAKIEAEKQLNYLSLATSDSFRAKVGKASQDALEALDTVLADFDLAPRTKTATRRALSLAAWIESEKAAGRDPAIPPDIASGALRKPVQSLTTSELAGLYDTVKTIKHQADRKNRLRLFAKEVDKRDTVAELVSTLGQNVDRSRQTKVSRVAVSRVEKARDVWERSHYAKLKIGELVRRADGDDPNGPWHRTFIHPVNDATKRLGDLRVAIARRIADALGILTDQQREELFSEHVYIRSAGQHFSYSDMLEVLLNTMNESNRRKLLQGGQPDIPAWGPVVVDEMLSNLKKEHYDLAQSIVDILDEILWPEVEALERRTTGLAPPKIEGSEVQSKFGAYPGGYYPVIYDKRYSIQGLKSEIVDVRDLFPAGAGRAMTPHGHTEARIESFSAPISISSGLRNLTQHIDRVLIDLTHRETITSLWSIITDPTVITEMNRRFGESGWKQFHTWLRDLAHQGLNSGTDGDASLSRLAKWARINATVAALGYNLAQGMQNFANVSNASELVPMRRIVGTALRMLGPGRADLINMVRESSPVMAHRFDNVERDTAQAIRRIAESRLRAPLRFAMHLQLFTDAMVAYPTWLAAYEKARTTLDHDDAVRSADHVVTATLGSGEVKDLASVQRGPESQKLITVFYSWWNVLYNRESALLYDVRRSLRRHRIVRDTPRFLARTWALLIVPPILSALLVGEKPDDDEEYVTWALRKVAAYPFMGFVFLRHVAGAMERRSDPKYTPAFRILDEMKKSADLAGKLLDGEHDVEPRRIVDQSSDLVSYLFGLPLGAPRRTIEYAVDLASGDEEPESFQDVYSGLMRGKRR